MNFEDMKKIWDEQNQEHLYVINEQQLHNSIQAKKKGASKFINRMERMAILVNSLTGAFILTIGFLKHTDNIYASGMGLVMLLAAIYIYIRRLSRLKAENQFDRTMLGDLDHAISNAGYHVQLSYFMLIYFIPVGLLVIAGSIQKGKPVGIILLVTAFIVAVWFLGRWEHRSCHLPRKKRLEALKNKLMEQ